MWRALAGFALLLSLWAAGQARVLVVVVIGGEAMFVQSEWLARMLPTGAAGWLVPTAYRSPWSAPAWQPDMVLQDKTPDLSPSRRLPEPPDSDGRAGVLYLPLLRDASMPYGLRSSPDALPAPWQRRLQTARWAHVELQEVIRARLYSEFCTPEQAERLQKRAWRQVDRWLAFLMRAYDPQRDLVIVVGTSLVSPQPWAVWLRGRDVGIGWLRDDSVRVQGAGQTQSLLSTVHAALGHPISPAWGDRLHGDGTPASAEMLMARREAWLMRHPLWQGALWIRGAWIGLALLGVAWAVRARKEAARYAVVPLRVVGQHARSASRPPTATPPPKPNLMRLLFTPQSWGVWGVALGVASLFPAALPPNTLWSAPLIVLLATGLLVWLARALDAPLVGLGTVAGLGLIALAMDTLSGGHWNRDGLFGHTLLGGYRFYGVGNQYAALALSWALILCAVWLRIDGLPAGAVALFALLTLWMGWQSSNVGATLAWVGTLLLLGVPLLNETLRGRPPRIRWGSLLGLLIVAGMSLMLLWLNTPHLRGFWQGIAEPTIPNESSNSMLLRKLLINLGESMLSPWLILLGVSLLAIRWLHLIQPKPALPRALPLAWLGSGVLCFLLNDLGTLMAAIVAFHYWAMLFTQIQQEATPSMPNRTYTTGGKR
jgi:hypothetical protein